MMTLVMSNYLVEHQRTVQREYAVLQVNELLLLR